MNEPSSSMEGRRVAGIALQLVQRRHGPENVQVVPDSVDFRGELTRDFH